MGPIWVGRFADSTARLGCKEPLDHHTGLIAKHLGDSGPGVITIPGLMKLKVVHKPATEECEGINPFTKEPTILKAKPATKQVKIQPLKALKDLV